MPPNLLASSSDSGMVSEVLSSELLIKTSPSTILSLGFEVKCAMHRRSQVWRSQRHGERELVGVKEGPLNEKLGVCNDSTQNGQQNGV